MSDVTGWNGKELPQQQSVQVSCGFSKILDLESPTIDCNYTYTVVMKDASCVNISNDGNVDAGTRVITDLEVVAMQLVVAKTVAPGFADSILVDVDSIKMAEIKDCMPTISDLTDGVKIANSTTNVIGLTDITPGVESLVQISDQVTRIEIANPVGADVDNAEPTSSGPGYADTDSANRAEDADSMVDKLANVNKIGSADYVVEGLDLADEIAISDLADSRNREEWNNQEDTESNPGSRNHKQDENKSVPNYRDPTRAESDWRNKTDTESDSNK
ncbi:hypothetical protein CR513_07169, partial [Mucuna pruriens]